MKGFVARAAPRRGRLPSGESLGVPQRIDEEMWAASADTRSDLKNGLQLFEHATITHGFASRFTSLDPGARSAPTSTKLLRGEPGALQQIAFALKEIVYLFYYARRDLEGHRLRRPARRRRRSRPIARSRTQELSRKRRPS